MRSRGSTPLVSRRVVRLTSSRSPQWVAGSAAELRGDGAGRGFLGVRTGEGEATAHTALPSGCILAPDIFPAQMPAKGL